MDDRLSGRVAIVTGGGSSGSGIGNGRAAAIIFARKGAKVLIVDRDGRSAAETLKLIEDDRGEADVHAPADVTELDDCRMITEHAIKRWGRVDILLNNVGVSTRERVTVVDLCPDEWARIMTVNVQSMMQMSKFSIPAMIKSGGGSIINIGSFGGIYPSAGNSAYATSKGAVMALTRSLAVDHGANGIRVNCIAPGMMITPMGIASKRGETETEDARLKREDAEKERRRRLSLLGIDGTGWDIGYAALFLASDESRYITGVTLLVDGGASLR